MLKILTLPQKQLFFPFITYYSVTYLPGCCLRSTKAAQGILCHNLQKTIYRDFQIQNTWISLLSTIMVCQGQGVRRGAGDSKDGKKR